MKCRVQIEVLLDIGGKGDWTSGITPRDAAYCTATEFVCEIQQCFKYTVMDPDVDVPWDDESVDSLQLTELDD